MGYYRKKPIVIEARRFSSASSAQQILDLAEWCGGKLNSDPLSMSIPTLEGDHLASDGDWIIRGVAGEFYPCKPDIFAQTYEEDRA